MGKTETATEAKTYENSPFRSLFLVCDAMAEQPDLMDQYRCPTGQRGRQVAALMNRGHEPLTLWGLTKVRIELDYVILDVGCGGGKAVSRLAQLTPQGKVFGIDHSADMVEYSRKVNRTLIAQNRWK